MIIQYIILAICLIAAVVFITKKLVNPFKQQGCASDCGCASADLKKEIKQN